MISIVRRSSNVLSTALIRPFNLQHRCYASSKKPSPSLSFASDDPIEPISPALPPLEPIPRRRRKGAQVNAVAHDPYPPNVEESTEARQNPSRRRKSQSAKADTKDTETTLRPLSALELEIELQLETALNEQRIPDSPLAKTIFKNWKRFPDCIVLTRVGKFYESYYDAAKHLTSIIDIKLTHKTQKVRVTDQRKGAYYQFPFAGFPVASLDKWLKILVQDLGHTVVLVEEGTSEDVDGLRERKVGQVITPGTLIDASWLSSAESRYLLSIAVSPEIGRPLNLWLAYTDVSTGELFSKETTLAKLEDEIVRIAPREIVLDLSLQRAYASADEPTRDDHTTVSELLALLRVFGAHVSFADTYQSPEIEGMAPVANPETSPLPLETQAISLLRHHLIFALRDHVPDLSRPETQPDSAYMHIDAATLTGLEIRHAIRYGEGQQMSPISVKGTLLSVIDKTVSPGGHRLLVRTICAPLMNISKIESRQALVAAFVNREDLRTEVQEMLKPLKDLPRLVQRLKHRRGTIDDLWEIGLWIRSIKTISDRIQREVRYTQETDDDLDEFPQEQAEIERLSQWANDLNDVSAVCEKIQVTMRGDIIRAHRTPEVTAAEDEDLDPDAVDETLLMEDPLEYPEGMSQQNKALFRRYHTANLAEGQRWWINPNANETLRKLHQKLAETSQQRQALQDQLQKAYLSDPKQLLLLVDHEKMGPVVFVSKAADRAAMNKNPGFRTYSHGPYTRFLEYDAWLKLGNTRRIIMEQLEKAQRAVYLELQEEVDTVASEILHNSKLVDELDLSMGFAETADTWQWVKPKMTSDIQFQVDSASHPVVEAALLSSARTFVRNSIAMTPESHLHIITGPNQGGKSTLLRQAAIIAILAQSGSFVPAQEAEIGIVDQLFSRIGARDDLFRDRSTFMLEMVETAAILRDATKRSLVIMDEIGRGTTLQAGMAIAYATLDYILTNIGCRTLFATHYHELEEMLRVTDPRGIRPRDGIEYWCTDVDEMADGAVSYSYHLKPGINYNSHAILAARMAGMPRPFMQVAQEKLDMLQAEKERLKSLERKDVAKDGKIL